MSATAGCTSTQGAATSWVRLLVLVSALSLSLQVVSTDYGNGVGAQGAAGFWFLVGVGLLWLMYRRRSRVARGTIIVTSLGGAVVYGLVAVQSADAALLAALFLGQALPLLAGPVRRHVRPRREVRR